MDWERLVIVLACIAGIAMVSGIFEFLRVVPWTLRRIADALTKGQEFVVYCKDCKFCRQSSGRCTAEVWNRASDECPQVKPNDFCSYGKRQD